MARSGGVSGTALLAVSKGWTQVCGLVVLILGARLLSVEDFGVFALATALSMILNQFVGVGAYEYVIREAGDDEAPHSAFWLNTITALAFTAVGCAIAVPAADFYGAPQLAPLVLIMSPLAIPAGWRSVGESLLIRRNQLGAAGVSAILQETIALGFAVTALASGMGIWSLAVHKVVQFCLGPVIFFSAARWLPKLAWSRARISGILKIAGPLTADRALAFVMTYGADLVLGRLLNPAAVGVYRIGMRIVTALQFVVIETLKSRAWARMSAVALNARGALAAAGERAIGQGWILCAPAFVGLAITADLVVRLALGPGWSESATVVQLLSVAALGSVVGIVIEPLAAIHARVTVLVALRIATMVVLIPSVIVAAPMGATAVAGVQLALAVVFAVANVVIEQRLFGMRWDASRTEAMAALTGCGVMWALVSGIRLMFAGAGDTMWVVALELGLTASLGAAAYAATLWLIRRRIAPALFASWAG